MRVSHLSIEELYKTPEWRRLSVQQRFFVQSYLASGMDQVFATNCAYGITTSESARAFSYKIVKAKKVRAALDRYFCKSPRQILIEQMQSDIAEAKPGSTARVQAQKVLAQFLTGDKLPKRSKRK
jgi:hypothetical protein